MKLSVMSMQKAEIKKIDMPKQFSEPVRPDLIKRAVKAIESHNRQPYGSYLRAGQRHTAYVSKRRHWFRATYGIGQSRTPRKTMSVRGTRFNWVGAVVPQTVGGRRAHPPKAAKIWDEKVNKKENRKSIRSALSATLVKEVVEKRGHMIPAEYPFILENKAEDITKTKDAVALLEALGIGNDLARSAVKKIRAGKGKMRGRKYKTRIGPLVVVSSADCAAMKAFSNIPGVDVEVVEKLNAQLLAPGTVPGRLTLFTEKAIERIDKENMFTDDVKLAGKVAKKEEAPKAEKPANAPVKKAAPKPAAKEKKAAEKAEPKEE